MEDIRFDVDKIVARVNYLRVNDPYFPGNWLIYDRASDAVSMRSRLSLAGLRCDRVGCRLVFKLVDYEKD
jgi:hypothetical protein